MTPYDFKMVLENRIRKIREVLDKKAGEYARGQDRLHNFKRVAEIKRITVAEANIDGFCKHLVSILDMVDDQAKGQKWALEVWDEKIGDAINYLILLEAIIKENYKIHYQMAGGGCPDEGEPVRSGGMEGL